MGLGYRHQQIGRSPLSGVTSFSRWCGWHANLFWSHWSIKHPLLRLVGIRNKTPLIPSDPLLTYTEWEWMRRFVINNLSVFPHVSVPNCSLLFSPSLETALGLHFTSMLLILFSSWKKELVLWPHKENREFSQEIPMTLLNIRGGTCGSQRSLWEEIKGHVGERFERN